MNYTELVAAIEEYVVAGDSEFTGRIPDFVRIAEQRVYNSVQLPALRKTDATGQLTQGVLTYAVPADWLGSFSVAITLPSGQQSFLVNKDASFLRQAYPDPSVEAVPRYYALSDQDTFLFAPTPDDDYPLTLQYYHYPESIVDAGNSWLGDNFHYVLLYGAIREAYVFLKGEADLQAEYEKRYQEALGQLKQYAEGKARRDVYRSGQSRVPVI